MQGFFLVFVLIMGGLMLQGNSFAGGPLSWKVEYDDQGRIIRGVDPAGRVTKYNYTPSAKGSLQDITVTPPEGEPVTWRLEGEGRLAAMKDGQGEVEYRYGSSGRLESIQRKGGPAIRYKFDALDRLSELRVGDFYRMAWTYDFLGRVLSLDTPAGPVRYAYQTGQNTVIRTLPNGVKTFWKSQLNGELQEIIHGFFKKQDDTSYSVLAEYKYEHGPEGRIETISERSVQGEFTRRYAYDKMGRLTDATGPSGPVYHYEYDSVGNRTKATATGQPDQICTYDWAGRLSSVDGKPCKYDACGNLTEVSLGGEARQYRYRPDGRLAEAQAGGESVQYRYDGFGRLVARKTTVGETRFIPDPYLPYWRPLVTEEPGGARTLVIWDGTAPLALVRNGKAEWLLHDHLGSVRLVTDSVGRVTRQVEYGPFGTIMDNQMAREFAPRFAGLFWAPESKVYLTMARAYRPEVGLFAQSDPKMGVPDASQDHMSLYSYCEADPVNFLDQDGKERRHYGDEVDIFVSGISMRQEDAQRVARQYLGPNAIGISVDHGPLRPPDILWAAADQTTGGHVTRTEEKLWSQLSQYRNIGTLEVYSHGAIATGNLSLRIDRAISRGTMKIGKVVFYGVNADEHLTTVLQKHNIPFSVRAHKYDPVRIVTTPNAELGSHIPILGRIPFVKSVLGGVEKVGVALTLLPGIPGPYSTNYHDINFLHGVAASTNNLPSADSYRRLPVGSNLPPEAVRPEPRKFYKRPNDFPPFFPPPPPPNGGAALAASPVGGVYLGGAGGAVDGLGMLKGVRIDSNGNLVLIGEDDGEVKLPPLRLDDVVTVFRSVYLYGEGPTVTIDPNPENPEKSAMIIRHGKASEDTYVGWILYQADRLMKSYSQGVDNKTEKDVVSNVSGYSNILDTIYFGGADPRKSQKEGVWERFWIVPAEARRFDGPRRELTLLDVPLKVKTQKMKWEKDKLVDDTKGKSSPGATAFTSWFTGNYNGIAAEQHLTPPPESGITGPVPVFAELRRIALLTAVAEKLRDQGIAMPFWMRDYEVRKLPFERFTPGMEVTRKRQQGNAVQTARIFGGVELSPDNKSVKTYNTVADAAKAPAEIRTQVVQNVKLADSLERAVTKAISPVAQEPLAIHQIREADRSYQAVSVPGAETLALGPCRLDEVDLAVPVEGGQEIQLVRSFNSFFDPKGPWGRGWALDLPRLEEIRVPISRKGNEAAYSIGFELLSPLNDLYACFRNVRPVGELGGAKLLVPETEGPFHGLSEAQPDFLKQVKTRVFLLKDGRQWHFTKQGDLVATKDGPQLTVYERGPHGRLTGIFAVLGGQVAGRITLEYSPDGRLTKAVSDLLDNGKSRPLSVIYTYNDSGQLVGVSSEDGTVGYRYEGTKVSAVTWQEKGGSKKAEVVRAFQYDSRGRVLSEKNGDATIVHSVSAGAEGVVASTQLKQRSGSGKGTGATITHYDQRMRPTEAVAADGTSTHWVYPADGGVEMTVTLPDKKSVKIVESPDGRKRTTQQVGAPPITESFDSGGRLTKLAEGDKIVLAQEWRPDGQLWRATTAGQGSTYEYDQYGLLSAITLHPAKAGEKLSEWQNTKLDRKGRPVEIRDYTGMKVLLGYDASGSLNSAVQKTPEGNFGYNVKHNDQGRIEAVESSWGETVYAYNKDGSLKRVVGTCRGRSASAELASGRVQSFTGFDGGHTTIAYRKSGPAEGMPETIMCPNGLKLNYNYAAGGDLSAVKGGAERFVRLGYDKQGRVTSYAWEPVNP